VEKACPWVFGKRCVDGALFSKLLRHCMPGTDVVMDEGWRFLPCLTFPQVEPHIPNASQKFPIRRRIELLIAEKAHPAWPRGAKKYYRTQRNQHPSQVSQVSLDLGTTSIWSCSCPLEFFLDLANSPPWRSPSTHWPSASHIRTAQSLSRKPQQSLYLNPRESSTAHHRN
jgi:hypothetical protein